MARKTSTATGCIRRKFAGHDWLDHQHKIVEIAANAQPCTSKASDCPKYGGINGPPSFLRSTAGRGEEQSARGRLPRLLITYGSMTILSMELPRYSCARKMAGAVKFTERPMEAPRGPRREHVLEGNSPAGRLESSRSRDSRPLREAVSSGWCGRDDVML